MKTFKQIIKEFWLPLIMALLWSFYNLYNTANPSVTYFVNIFVPTFFLVSWLCGQYFRIRKQNKVESEFDKVQEKLNKFFEQLAIGTENIINNLTGGDSFCYWYIANIDSNNNGFEMIGHQGDYPLFNIQARIVDLDESALSNDASIKNIGLMRFVQNLIPKHAFLVHKRAFDLGSRDKRRFNIFWTASNGSFEQKLNYRKINGEWTWASKVTRNDMLLYEHIHKNFPRNEKDEVDW